MRFIDLSFRALNRETARQIAELLREGPRSVSDIAAHIKTSRPAVSQSLALLQEARLVDRRRQGRHNIYQLRMAGWRELGSYAKRYMKAAKG